MHTGAFAAAGQRLADTDDSFSSAPRGILIGQIPQILRAKKFDGTRGGQRLDIWLEEIDKAIIVNPDVFRQWKGDATDRSIAEQSLRRFRRLRGAPRAPVHGDHRRLAALAHDQLPKKHIATSTAVQSPSNFASKLAHVVGVAFR